MPRYDARRIESKWQAYWEENHTFRCPEHPAGEKLYVLDMFPYPSGEGLHVGHPEGYTATDIVCRFARMNGKSVLHPMGWDAFGLPAEDYAVKTGTHPRVTTEKNIATFRRQLKMLGFSYDWDREISTTDPEYYRWTQWIFLQLFDTWYDADFEWTHPSGEKRVGKGRPIAELPIPDEIRAQGTNAVRRYQDAHRLAYQHEAPVNWCPALGTVLANEEVQDGVSERGGHPVVRLPLRQWMLRITSYAERLLSELDQVQWPESVKLLQRNWIGRSEGAEVDFYIGSSAQADASGWAEWKTRRQQTGFPGDAGEEVIRVYTTRPDTLYGVTYMVLSPEHPLVARLTTAEQRALVEAYQKQASLKSDLDRTDLAKDKTGVFTGGYAINPVNGERVPVWIADYVLSSYGTGAIMAVPAHDERDFAFAEKFQIPIRPVVAPTAGDKSAAGGKDDSKGFFAEGVAINSAEYNGLATAEFKPRITTDLAARGWGRKAVNYRLRDWLFSRQRYWGEPFPIWHELDDQGEPTGLMRVDRDDELPVLHPHLENFQPSGRPDPMLAKASDEWLFKTAADGVRLKRETNSMPQWAGSCWYYLRFIDPKNSRQFIDPVKEREWMPVDLYIGGAEHAVLHLLYSRFWHKVLFDRGLLSQDEPFRKLVNQGMILGEAELTAFQTAAGKFVSVRGLKEDENGNRLDPETGEPVQPVSLKADQVTRQGNDFVLTADPAVIVESRAYKMSKSRGNVVNPDTIVREYGADSLRLYEMFMGPLEASKPWSMSGVEGVSRFLGRVWRMIADDRSEELVLHPAVQAVEPTADQLRMTHKTIEAVTRDLHNLSFNTAISRLMEFVNEFATVEPRPKSCLETFVLLLSPLAPHLAEELWQMLGHDSSLALEPWPQFDAQLLVQSTVEIPVQVNGKLRGRITVCVGSDQAAVEQACQQDPKLKELLAGKTPVKTIFVTDRLLNFVVK